MHPYSVHFDMKYRFQRENTQEDNGDEGRVCANFCAQKLGLGLELCEDFGGNLS